MNLLDLILLAVVVIAIVSGMRRGFLVGTYEIVLAVAGLIFAAQSYHRIGELAGRVIDASEPVLNVIGFVAGYLLIQIVGMVVLGPLLQLLRKMTGFVPGTRAVDHLAGVVPGVIQGLIIATIIVLPLGFFPVSSFAGAQLEESEIGMRLFRQSTNVALRATSAVGLDLTDFVALTPKSSGDSYVLPFEVSSGLEVNEADEAEMVRLINQERRAAGLQPLTVDPELTAVARAHSREMFREGYFAHQSPITGSPFDRLDAAGVDYRLAGENLALSRNVQIAHEGLMDSPGHRRNILEPGYSRVGVGAITSDQHGTMYTQVFAN